MNYSPGACQQCGGHIEFPTEAAGQKIECPHCHWETEMIPNDRAPSARRPPVVMVLLVLALLGVLGWAALMRFGKRTAPPVHAPTPVAATNSHRATNIAARLPAPDPWHGLTAGPIKFDKSADGNLIFAVGVVHNTTSRQRFGVKIELNVFDAQGHKLDPATDYTQVIEPGKDWHFRAMVVDRNATRAKLRSIQEEK